MTKSRESGENEITAEAKREAARTNSPLCPILAEMLTAARKAGDAERIRRTIQAQKFAGCRNIRKRTK